MDAFLEKCEEIMTLIANVSVYILEIIGITIIIVGAIRAVVLLFLNKRRDGKRYNIKINLAEALALGLEFKMGAEIIKTVIVKKVEELLILGAIIALRAILALLIHWEIKVASKDEKEKKQLEKMQGAEELEDIVAIEATMKAAEDKAYEEASKDDSSDTKKDNKDKKKEATK